MPTLITAETSITGKSIILRRNDFPADWRKLCIPISSVCHIVEEDGEGDGINIIMLNGTKYTLKPAWFTSVGAITEIVTNADLCDAFIALANL